MKVNFVQTTIAIAISGLISFGFYNFHSSENQLFLSIGSFIFLSITFALSIGINFELSRTTTNIRVVSGIFFTITLISNLIFSFFSFTKPSYLITNGILLLIYVLIVDSIYISKQ